MVKARKFACFRANHPSETGARGRRPLGADAIRVRRARREVRPSQPGAPLRPAQGVEGGIARSVRRRHPTATAARVHAIGGRRPVWTTASGGRGGRDSRPLGTPGLRGAEAVLRGRTARRGRSTRPSPAHPSRRAPRGARPRAALAPPQQSRRTPNEHAARGGRAPPRSEPRGSRSGTGRHGSVAACADALGAAGHPGGKCPGGKGRGSSRAGHPRARRQHCPLCRFGAPAPRGARRPRPRHDERRRNGLLAAPRREPSPGRSARPAELPRQRFARAARLHGRLSPSGRDVRHARSVSVTAARPAAHACPLADARLPTRV